MTKARLSKVRKIIILTFTAVATVVAVLLTVTGGWRPVLGARSRALTDRHFERTQELLARGHYLANSVLGCLDCHSREDGTPQPGVAPVFSHQGGGRVLIDQGGFVLAASNITPDTETGAGSWTDDQFARAIREGIGHDGRALFPMMPYQNYRNLSDEDLAAVVVYIRSLEPVRNILPQPQIPFPLSRLIQSAPQPVLTRVAVNDSDRVSRGRYLTHIGGCIDCHTPVDQMHRPIKNMELAGGNQIDGSPVRSANLTPDPTGISYYDEDLFVRALRTGHVGARALNPPMPWWVYRNMSDDDLKSIFAYLRTVKPIHNRVENSEIASR